MSGRDRRRAHVQFVAALVDSQPGEGEQTALIQAALAGLFDKPEVQQFG